MKLWTYHIVGLPLLCITLLPLLFICSLPRLRPEDFLVCQGQAPVSSTPVLMMVRSVRRVVASIFLDEADDVPVASGICNLDAGGALEGITLAAPSGGNFVDEMLYLGHSPSEEGRNPGCG